MAEAAPEGEEVEAPPRGVFVYPNGEDKYDGEWAERVYGEGEVPPEPPAPEEGEEPVELKTYCRHGVGRSTCAGGVYDGEWVQDAMEGAGVFEYVTGAKYEGNWKANKYDGAGTYVWPDGSKYQGEFVENVMHGKGTFVDKDGREWIGDFYNNTGPGLKLIL